MQTQGKAVPEEAGRKFFVNLEGTEYPPPGTPRPSRFHKSGTSAAGTAACRSWR
jgi:hypothetical protein